MTQPPPHPTFTAVPHQRCRADGWTPERQQVFLEALAESGCVQDACRAVGMSPQSAYALKARPEAESFRNAWAAALHYAIDRMGDALVSRAIHGVAVPHYHKGEQVGEHRRYDNRLALFLLQRHRPLRYATTPEQLVGAEAQAGAPAPAVDFREFLENAVIDARHEVDSATGPEAGGDASSSSST